MDFSTLSPEQFENMTFDLLQSAGLMNLVWRTPGADGGRDIEGTKTSVDFSNYFQSQRWYVECKRYASSIDWPTVWNKIAYAESRKADFLLLVTNSNPSPKCESEIAEWNNTKRSVHVRVWRGYELEGILRNYPQVAAKYGLLGSSMEAELSLQTLMFEATKLAQAAYVAHELGTSSSSILEAGASLAELISARYEQIRAHGRMVPIYGFHPPVFNWLEWKGPCVNWDEVGLRSLITFIRHLTRAETIKVLSTGDEIEIQFLSGRFPVEGSGERALKEIATWSNCEMTRMEECAIHLSQRKKP